MNPAERLVGIVTAASQALESGFALADPKIAWQSASHARLTAEAAPEVGREAAGLQDVAQSTVIQVVSDRLARHWRAYEKALNSDLTVEQVLSIHFALLTCMNKELENLRDLEPTLPPGAMRRWWLEYS